MTAETPFWHRMVWDEIESVVSNADVLALLFAWQALPRRNADLPDVDDFALHREPVAEPLRLYVPKVMVLDALDDGDFKYLHYGVEISRHSQINMTGKRVSEFGGVLAPFFLDCYRSVQAQRRPLYTLHYSDRASSVFTWERLILPLQRADGGLTLVVYNQPLEMRAHLLDAVLDGSHDAILALRRVVGEVPGRTDWMVLVANKTMCELADAGTAKIEGRPVAQALPRWQALGFADLCERALASAHELEEERFIAAHPSLDGEGRWFSVYCAPLQEGCLVRLSDITEAKVREQQLEKRVAERTEELSNMLALLKRSQEELVDSEKLASLGSLVAGVSHELNTPIGNVLMLSSTLQDRVAEFSDLVNGTELKRAELQRFLSFLGEVSALQVSTIRKAADLITSFKQVAVDQTSQRRRDFLLHDVVEDVLNTLGPTMKKSSAVQIRNAVPSNIGCDGFPGPLGQVITNLVQNSFTHGFTGGPDDAITLQATLDAASGWVHLQVMDNGVGMELGVVSRIFDPFFTTRLGQGGSGLGLAISHRIVTSLLGGKLTVESTPGQGSCFTVAFPAKAPTQL
ncbi:PAS domain-containing protein [Rhodoferax sp. AJA081-3]|uniref:sensor histidine kinase n=1 Tax=Rhodoferax sp. AJA081-3 TaxID=2752316 RepID=UPI001ADECD66|nr:PAS domain-containing sensor histidine kinase [Rhodoferax sp. AJA081-3]QTN29821.1 PAS domain-containing protein [Rhodoferax sp. AJA081-3]